MTVLVQESIQLLSDLIAVPSFSGQEDKTADLLEEFLTHQNLPVQRYGNNIIVQYQGAADSPYVLLCSHHDTVKPNTSYSRDPFESKIENGKIFGLGSNDAGASLVCLIAAFLSLVKSESKINLVLAAVAEEETSGPGGVTSILNKLPSIELAVVGEPTSMQLAVAEKGLVVIDGISTGIPGHAAHENTENPIYTVCRDILAIQEFKFDRSSEYLGSTKASVTVVHAGQLHNQVPAECQFVIDVRVNEKYTLEEVVEELQALVKSKLSPRSLRLHSSSIPPNHPILAVAKSLEITKFGSATLSDQALMPFPSIKIGPGDTLRSHTADEFVFLAEIEEGIKKYIQLLEAYTRGI